MQETNSAVADKPHDAFVQMQWRIAVLKHASAHMCCHAEFGSIGRSALKGVGINTGEPPKLGSARELCCLEMGGVGRG